MLNNTRISCSPTSSIVPKDSTVHHVSSYNYPGIMIDDKLAWHDHIDYLILLQEVELLYRITWNDDL